MGKRKIGEGREGRRDGYMDDEARRDLVGCMRMAREKGGRLGVAFMDAVLL